MGIQISYMGTKRYMAGVVVELTKSLPSGPLLDVFSGMCAVGERLAAKRVLWTNDFLVFPALAARCLFTSDSPPPTPDHARMCLEIPFKRNIRALESRFSQSISKEERFLSGGSLSWALKANSQLPYVGTDRALDTERRRLEKTPTTFPYRLASITYAGGYFGIRQSMEIDSLRFAIDHATLAGEISKAERDWLLVALGQAISRANNSTGHFAQYLKPRPTNLKRILQKRRKSVHEEFFAALASVSPVGSEEWRAQNLAFCSDALDLLRQMKTRRTRPSIIYADPPYSRAQYSRYYHVLDTIVEYHYPGVSGEGRYPNRRPRTLFALEAHVVASIQRLVEYSAELDASLVLSYPSNGLLTSRGLDPLQVMRRYYRRTELAFSVERQHSTFGAAASGWKVPVRENVYVGFS